MEDGQSQSAVNKVKKLLPGAYEVQTDLAIGFLQTCPI